MQEGSPEVINPKTYTSPSGEYSLYVNPSDRYGAGKAIYRLSRKTTVVWSGERPFTLWEAGVADDGTAGGYAYSSGPAGRTPDKPRPDRGNFQVVILDSTGATRLYQEVKRTENQVPYFPPNPFAAGLIVDGANERLVIRIVNLRQYRRTEMWWVYQLSTGKEIKRFAPHLALGMGEDDPARFPLDARAVAGTPLTLLDWWRADIQTSPWSSGVRFTLMDAEGNAVWVHDLPLDYTIPGNPKAQDRLRDEMQRTSAILDANTPGRFTLRFVADKQRVTFAVTPDEGGKWRVEEVGREAYVPATKAVRLTGPEVHLILRDRIEPRDPGPRTPHPIRNVFEPVAAGPGRLAFLRRDEKTDLVVVSDRGAVLYTVSLEKIPRKAEDYIQKLLWQNGTHFLVLIERRNSTGREAYTEAYQVDARTGSIAKLAGFRCPAVRAVAAFPDGGFVLLGTVYEKDTLSEGVYAYDAQGRRAWTIARPAGLAPNGPPEMLFSPQSLTVLKDGTVAVLDNVKGTVQMYDRHGRYRKRIFVAKVWEHEGNCPADILADPGAVSSFNTLAEYPAWSG